MHQFIKAKFLNRENKFFFCTCLFTSTKSNRIGIFSMEKKNQIRENRYI